LASPTKTGYTFNGWSTSWANAATHTHVSASDIKSSIDSFIATSDNLNVLTLYADWTINTYDIDSTSNEGEHTSITAAASANYYSDVTFSASADAGYDLTVGVTRDDTNANLTLTNNGNGTYTFTMPECNVTIVTSTSAQEYAITYSEAGNWSGDIGPSTHRYGIATSIPNPVKTGYTFAGWIVNGLGAATKNLTLAADGYTAPITLTGTWTANEYKIYFDLNGGTFANTDGLTYDNDAGKYYKTINFDANISNPSPNIPGYNFTGWTVGGNALTNGSTFTYPNDVTAIANYES
jgi:uncharacterized repeat protein (TIGR02543 family)